MSLEWVEGVPADWKISESQFVLDYHSRGVQEGDEIVTAFRDGQVTLRSNRRTDGFTMADKEIGYQHICKGDLVVHSMDGGFGAIGVSDSCGKASPVVHAYTSSSCDLRFVSYQLRAAVDAGWIVALAKGIRVRSTQFDRPALASLKIAYPGIETQQRIADYLDRETAEIDAAVADLDRYVESMTSRMSLFVSNALDKDKHPAVPIFTFASISAGDSITAESIGESGDFPVYGGNGLRGFANLHNQQGDRVLIGRQGALCGNVHFAKGPFFASEHALVVAPHKKINLVWLEHALRDLNLRLLSQASAQPGISASEVSRQRVNLPPFEAQHAIAQRISNETERMNALIADSTRLRELLLKRRSVLITDVVTGRKQV